MNRRQFILGIASIAALPMTGKPSYALNLTADAKFKAAFIAVDTTTIKGLLP